MQTKNQFTVRYERPTESSVKLSIRNTTSRHSARIEGPYCKNGRTLRSTVQFESHQDQLTCQLIDPVFWSPEFPAYYRVDVFADDEKIDTQRLGIRKLECSRGSLFFNSRRWVLRAAWSDSLSVDDCQRENVSIVCDDPSDEFLNQATDSGVFVVVNLEEFDDWKERMEHLSRFPCIGMFILDNTIVDLPRTNQLLAHRFPPHDATPASWAHVLMSEYSEFNDESKASVSHPLVCYRSISGEPMTRAACDGLQRDLAPEFDLAGYVVKDEVTNENG